MLSLLPASYSEGGSPHEYNAHYVDAYFTPKLFIVADGPEESTIVKFWQMVWDQDCSCLIMLTPLDAHVCIIHVHGIYKHHLFVCCNIYKKSKP